MRNRAGINIHWEVTANLLALCVWCNSKLLHLVPSGSLMSTRGWQLEGRLSLRSLLICCSTRGAGRRDDNAYGRIQLQGCLLPRWEATLNAENSVLPSVKVPQEMFGGLQMLGGMH